LLVADAAGGLVEKVEGEFEFVVHGGSPFRVVSSAPVSAAGCGPGFGGAVNPEEPGVGGGGFSARMARSASRRAPIGPKAVTRHAATRPGRGLSATGPDPVGWAPADG
jgi:hypothetical protein